MNAIRTLRGRRLLPLLAICSSLAGFSPSARADALVSQLTDKATPGLASARAGLFSAHVVYRSRQEEETTAENAEEVERTTLGALPVLAVILIFSPETGSIPPPPPPPPPPNILVTPPPDGGTGHTSGGPPTPTVSNPEPASLILALTGSATAAVLALARRRRRAVASPAI